MATELSELFFGLLQLFNPKRMFGKIVWGLLLALALAVLVIEILAAMGY
jgi:hypothetical protein